MDQETKTEFVLPIAHEFDWTTVVTGTRVVVERLHLSRQAAAKWIPRDDGLYEVAFLRMRKTTHECKEEVDGEFVDVKKPVSYPLFCEPGDPKKTCNVGYQFAFADNPDQVAALLAYVSENKKRDEIRKQEHEAKRQDDKRQREDNLLRLQEERDKEMRAKAAAIGVSVEDLVDGCKQWDQLRSRSFRANCCFLCNRTLTDPVSIKTGIGPECVKEIPNMQAAMKANAVDIGKLRFRSQQLVDRLTRAGFDTMAEMVREAGYSNGS